jgi:hypothetical protein
MLLLLGPRIRLSVVHTTGSLSAHTHIRSDGFIRAESRRRKRKQPDAPMLHPDCDVPETLALRFRSKMAVLELGRFCDFIPVFSGPHE